MSAASNVRELLLRAIFPAVIVCWPVTSANATTCATTVLATLTLRSLEHGLLAVPAKINNAKTWLVVDTGGGFSLLTPTFSRKAGLEIVDEGRKIGTFFAGKTTSSDARTNDFQLAAMPAQKMGFAVVDVDFSDDDVGGTVGADFLDQYSFAIDPLHKTLTFYSPDLCEERGGNSGGEDASEIPLLPARGNQILVPASLDGMPVKAVIDTGSPNSYLSGSAARSWLARRASSSEPSQLQSAQDAYQFSLLQIGSIAFRNLTIYVMNPDEKFTGPELLLGMDFVERTKLLVRSDARTLFLTENDAKENAQR